MEIKCPLCGSSNVELWRSGNFDYSKARVEDFKITDSDYGLFPDFLRCNACDLRFAREMPTVKQLIQHYSGVVDPEYNQESEGRGENFIRILKLMERLRRKGDLLDVGAATGILMELAEKRGWKTWGVEASKWAFNIAEKRGLRVLNGDFLSYPEDKKFDAITMVDIIEHMATPGKTLEKAKNLLKEGGLLVIVTPDIGSFTARIMGKRWWHLRPAHVNFFSRKTIKWSENFGFRILRLRNYIWNFSLHYLVTRFKWGRKYFNWEWLKKLKLKLILLDSLEAYLERLP